MKRYLELTGIARALKVETWRRCSDDVGRGNGSSGRIDTSPSDPRRPAAGLALTACSAGPP